MGHQNTLPTHRLQATHQFIIDREAGQYLGHPDTILLDDDQTILTVYPKGHGKGEVILKESTDGGQHFSERRLANPTWKTSRETPTLYKLDFISGEQLLISISGGPDWGDGGFTGFQTSLSADQGVTWTDYKQWFEGRPTIVAMASLVRLKDANGNWLDQWLGVYHDADFVNYQTILSFAADGTEQWSEPVAYLAAYREWEQALQLCEVCMFRSPDGAQLALLARSQSHMHQSTVAFSDDEGATWTRPREVSPALTGERHKMAYDPVSGRMVVSFREIILDYNQDGIIEADDWMAGDWVAWVGTYDDLVHDRAGQYRILLGEDFTPSRKSGDCGYAGIVAMQDGTFFLNSYGHFDEAEVEALGTDVKPYILGVRFALTLFDK